MGKRRPERESVENLIKANRRRKAHDIAGETGLIEIMGYDKAVDYVRQVRKSMRKTGALPPEKYKYASDHDRLEDITTLFEIRKGKMSKSAAHTMLLLNCYYRFRSEDDKIHMGAIDDTYEKNNELEDPFPLNISIGICDIALAQYMLSIDEEKQQEAKRRGFPGAGLNYTSATLIDKLEITDDELQHMKSIRREP